MPESHFCCICLALIVFLGFDSKSMSFKLRIIQPRHSLSIYNIFSDDVFNSNADSDDLGFIKRKGKKNRDALPYEVYITDKNNKNILGTFYLDPSTACGDILQVKENTFLVERVTYVYKYQNRRHRVFLKKLDVAPINSPYANYKADEIFQ